MPALRPKLALCVFLYCLWLTPLHAMTLEQPLANPAMEAQAQEMFRQLRCITCESQSLYDSQAPLAEDIRRSIRAKLQQGIDASAILEELHQHYGDVIFLTPPARQHPWLWALPVVIACVGVTGFGMYAYRHKATS